MYRISLKEIIELIAIAKTEKDLKKSKCLETNEDYLSIEGETIMAYVNKLRGKVSNEDFTNLWGNPYLYYKPFQDYSTKITLSDRLVVLADSEDKQGNPICFYLYQPVTMTNEEFILSLSVKQRNDCYVIYKGMLQRFKIVNKTVVYKEVGEPEGVTLGAEEIESLRKRVSKLRKELYDLSEYIESITK
ncbi:hypothetical protein SAMN02745136_00532 [Anaerocolumna jejuensis DSM 15929]|uniref:Uncharacterized protein n=1 Tax=Anaerocolumna jejuensis DSM 15929 TaxID=1121322 RepID=A0A1M6KPI8_9FIRM|nr:hypothetical protein [Anaerocolumna jejuensis]SHJ60879.1 hypothetical protein SAMN02745136_00532 [Anaerocolumna jejuensis DSM 15929]